MGYKRPVNKFPSAKALRQSVIRLSSRLTKFRKEPNSAVKDALIKSFLAEDYSLSKYLVRGKLSSSSNSSSSCTCCQDLESEKEILLSQKNDLLSEISAKNKVSDYSRKKVKVSQHKLYSMHRNHRKKILRRDEEIKSRNLEVKEKSKLIIHLEKRMVEAEIQIEDLKKRIDRIRHRVTYWKEKYSNLSMLNEELQIKLELDNEKFKQCYMKKYFN